MDIEASEFPVFLDRAFEAFAPRIVRTV